MAALNKVIIIGAGVFGTTAAWELAERGWQVDLISPEGEEADSYASTTDISKIVRLEYGMDSLFTRLCEDALDGWEAWNREWKRRNEPCLFHPSGLLILAGAKSGFEPGTFEGDSLAMMRERRHPIEILTSKQISKRYPPFNAEFFTSGGFLDHRSGWAESGEVLRFLLRRCVEHSLVTIHRGRVTQILSESNGAFSGVVLDSGATLIGTRAIVAAGAFSMALVPELSSLLRPVGQLVTLLQVPEGRRAFYSEPAFPTYTAAISETGFYGFPLHPDARVLKIGHHGAGLPLTPSQCSPEGIDRARAAIAESRVKQVRKELARVLPEAARFPLQESRLCLYCDSVDGDFVVDDVPGRPGLFVAAGGSGHAFKFAPILGQLVADSFTHAPNYATHRFHWRDNDGETSFDSARQMTPSSPASSL